MIGSIIGALGTVIDKIFPDADDAQKAKLKLLELEQSGELARITAAKEIVTAEAKGESWLQRNWRPLMMLAFILIIVNNYILVPYLSAFGLLHVTLDLPPKMWSLLEIGVGGYVVGRTVEKGIKGWKGNI